jgi:hypothetical protein
MSNGGFKQQLLLERPRCARAGREAIKKPISGFALGDGFCRFVELRQVQIALSFYERRHHHWPGFARNFDMAASITGSPYASQIPITARPAMPTPLSPLLD